MNYFKCINEVKPSYIVDAEPQFSETVLYENQTSAAEDTVTLSEDYHNFDIIKFYCYDTDNGNSSYYATPDMLDHMITDNNPYINLNVINTVHYITYQISSNTQLTRSEQRVLYVTKIVGLNCSNGTLIETEVYSRTKANTWVTIETELNLFEFDMILAQTTTGRWDECNINDTIFLRSNNKYLESNEIKNQLSQWRVSYYSGSHIIELTEHTMSSGRWYYVAGLKFIPNWDYYVENIIFPGTNGQQFGTGIYPLKGGNINRNWEISFKFTDNAPSANSGLVNMATNFNSGNANINVWRNGNGTISRILGTEMPSAWNNKNVKIKYTYNGGTSNSVQIYYDDVLVSTISLDYSGAAGYANKELELGRVSADYTTYYANGTLNYFGFRWLS